MSSFHRRLFIRIISKGKEVYFLKIISLAIALACSTLVLLFAVNELAYDRFHADYTSLFRVLQKNNQEEYIGSRLSNKLLPDAQEILRRTSSDSLVASRVKMMDELNVLAGDRLLRHIKLYAADPQISEIFSIDLLNGSWDAFNEDNAIILSASTSLEFFGTAESTGRELSVFTYGDTLVLVVAAVFDDFPGNSHEHFDAFVHFNETAIRQLNFNPDESGAYCKVLGGTAASYEATLNRLDLSGESTFLLQPLSEIYFGPRVTGEDARHGDRYSIIILLCITVLILFLAATCFVNLTTLTLPGRAKELAVKKLSGVSQLNLLADFAKESFSLVGISLGAGISLLLFTSQWIRPILSIDVVSLLLEFNPPLYAILAGLCLLVGIAPLFIAARFIRATPNRLLSTDAITFPQLKRTIMFLQLGISIFLIVSSMVMGRQINYSLLKEPGRNYDQVVYVDYPADLTNAGLISLRGTWKKVNPNIVNVMATSHLPDRISSKELNSPFYFMSVDQGFLEFFKLEMDSGNWFMVNAGDSLLVVNEEGRKILGNSEPNVIGVFRDMSGQFNQPARPIKMNVAPYFNYNFLCVRILEVDIRNTVGFLSRYFAHGDQAAKVSFLNHRFEEWLAYQDRLNLLSGILAIVSGVLSCFAIYGLSISIVRDKLKQIAIHKLFGADTFRITRLLVREFTGQMIRSILVFGPLTYLVLKEMLRTFVYSTHFNWLDAGVPLAYCGFIIALLCGFQTLSLNRKDLSSALR